MFGVLICLCSYSMLVECWGGRMCSHFTAFGVYIDIYVAVAVYIVICAEFEYNAKSFVVEDANFMM